MHVLLHKELVATATIDARVYLEEYSPTNRGPEGFHLAEIVHDVTASDNDTVGGTLTQPVLGEQLW